MEKETILCMAAHSDDLEIGMGATIAKYSQEGKEAIGVIFSNGAGSSPWIKQDLLIEDRKKEAKEIGAFMGCKETIFIGLKDGALKDTIENPKIKDILKKIITQFKPTKIFMHSKFDPHPDHRAVHAMVSQAIEEADRKKIISVYVFEVWNALPETPPTLYVDITDTFSKKIKAMKKFKSQKVFIYALLIPVYARALIAGIHNKTRYAEKFYKLQ